MAKLLVVDGPEKAGKSTLISCVVSECAKRKLRCKVEHWQPVPNSFYYIPFIDQVFENKPDDFLVIWDRSWVSEYVYSRYFRRDPLQHPFGQDPWLGEWSFGRALDTYGLKLILLGPSAEALQSKRDESDLKIPVAVEREYFKNYGARFYWHTTENPHNAEAADFAAEIIVDYIKTMRSPVKPPYYAGPVNSKVVFLGEAKNRNAIHSWLPFSSRYTTLLGREFGDDALRYGWTNVEYLCELNKKKVCDNPPTDQFDMAEFFKAKLVVACGQIARNYCNSMCLNYLGIDHPSSGFRWGSQLEKYRRQVDELKLELFRRKLYAGEEKEGRDERAAAR